MKVNIWAGMCLVIAWSLFTVVASVTEDVKGRGRRHQQLEEEDGDDVKSNGRRRPSYTDGGEWRRDALNAILVSQDGDPECNKAVGRTSVPSERLDSALRRHFVPQTRTASKFARLLVNYFTSTDSSTTTTTTTRHLSPEGGPEPVIGPNGNRLFSTLALSIVQSDRSIVSCAVDVMTDNRRWSSDRRSSSSSVPLAYRVASKSSLPTATTSDDGLVCVTYINDNNGVNKSINNNSNNHNNNNNNSSHASPSAIDCAYQVSSQAENDAVLDAMSDFRSRYFNVTMGNTTKTMTSLWGAIFYDCRRNTWMATYSLGLATAATATTTSSHDDTAAANSTNSTNTLTRWRGVLTMTLDLSEVDIDQCGSTEDDQHLFGGTNTCDPQTMECVHRAGLGFRVGSYRCVCRAGFYSHVDDVNTTTTDITHLDGSSFKLQDSASTTTSDAVDDEWPQCLPCYPGCYQCNDSAPCWAEYDLLLRGVPLGLQSFCMTITAVLGITIFQLRKCKVIATGMWTVLEMILVGALLLYSTVVVRYFEPETFSCLMEPWFREVGFAIFYGTITLKLYRILVDFRTRKAHRWVVRDKDLLKYLAGIIITIIGYMSAWTAITADQIVTENQEMIVRGQTDEGLDYHACKSTWWNYVTEAGELAFLLFGIYISYHTHHASSPFNENRYLCLAIYIEASSSLALYALRHYWWMSLHPDYIFIMYFTRCQLTVTINLLLIFGPKLWYHYRPPCEVEHKVGTGGAGVGGSGGGVGGGNEGVQGDRMSGPELVKLQDGITSNGEVDIGEINLADMDPEDIRAELRRVYTQLQVLRNKTMRKDNPHISKRRGGRKATHRRFSLQAFHRHRHHDVEHETDISKTPEESTGSADVGASLTATQCVGGDASVEVQPPPQQPSLLPQMSRCSSVRK